MHDNHLPLALTGPIRKALAGFTALGIVDHLDQATEDLRELTAGPSVSANELHHIDEATRAFESELRVARFRLGH